MKMYDYMVTTTNLTEQTDEDELTSLGESGWELVAVCNGRMYLKKTLDNEPPQPQKATP